MIGTFQPAVFCEFFLQNRRRSLNLGISTQAAALQRFQLLDTAQPHGPTEQIEKRDAAAAERTTGALDLRPACLGRVEEQIVFGLDTEDLVKRGGLGLHGKQGEVIHIRSIHAGLQIFGHVFFHFLQGGNVGMRALHICDKTLSDLFICFHRRNARDRFICQSVFFQEMS